MKNLKLIAGALKNGIRISPMAKDENQLVHRKLQLTTKTKQIP